MTHAAAILRWQARAEGQFLERKSALDRTGSRARARQAKAIARDIVETLSAMANADGGELVLGLEDDGELTGVPHPDDKVELFERAPRDRNYVTPPLPCRVAVIEDRRGRLLHFVVEWSPNVHRLADSRTLLRINDSNQPFASDQIAALKQTKAQGLFERTHPLGATMEDLDLDLVEKCDELVREDETPEALLQRYRLIEPRNGTYSPTLAALLLFGKDPGRWNPRCGIDFVRWEGTERRHGRELNIVKRLRIEEPLAVLIEEAYATISPFIRERQRLQDLFFTERLEYPTFVWQEAIVNAVAHRDYGIQGAPIEVWMFDDHIEIRSPGLPPAPVSVERLNRREHVHLSRNPLLVRVLADRGFMRDLGEGVPRMFDEMEREGFYPPRFTDVGGLSFQVTLRNQPVYDEETMRWLGRFRNAGLSGDQKRLLAFAHAHRGRFTSRDYQELVGLDIYAASNSIKDLIRKGIVRRTAKRGKVYVVADIEAAGAQLPRPLARLLALLRRRGEISNRDVRSILAVPRSTATRILSDLKQDGWLVAHGSGRWTRYALNEERMTHSPNESYERETESQAPESDS